MTHARFLVAPLVVALVASVGCANVATDEEETKKETEKTVLPLEGSYELHFAAAAVTLSYSGGGPEMKSPSLDHRARLDLRKTADGYEAVFTGRWMTSAVYTVAVSDTALTLTGEGWIGRNESVYSSSTDTWKTITLGRNASGGLSGSFQATGKHFASSGDVAWDGTVAGSGTVAADKTAPEVKSQPSSRIGPADRLLPWDTLVVKAAEPVARKDVIAATHAKGPSGEKLSLTWLPTEGETWAGATTFKARVDDWANAMKPSGWQFSQAAGIADRVGNIGGASDVSLKFLALPGPTRNVDFDTDTVEAAFWGKAEIIGGGLVGSDDPLCEKGGCLKIGPAPFANCGAPRAGMAATLNRGTGKIAVRYRILADNKYGGDKPYIYGNMLSMELATPGEPVTTVDVNASTITWKKLDAPIDGHSYASDWMTIRTDAPAGAAPIGIAIAAGGSPNAYSCGGPPLPSTDLVYLIESVTAE